MPGARAGLKWDRSRDTFPGDSDYSGRGKKKILMTRRSGWPFRSCPDFVGSRTFAESTGVITAWTSMRGLVPVRTTSATGLSKHLEASGPLLRSAPNPDGAITSITRRCSSVDNFFRDLGENEWVARLVRCFAL